MDRFGRQDPLHFLSEKTANPPPTLRVRPASWSVCVRQHRSHRYGLNHKQPIQINRQLFVSYQRDPVLPGQPCPHDDARHDRRSYCSAISNIYHCDVLWQSNPPYRRSSTLECGTATATRRGFRLKKKTRAQLLRGMERTGLFTSTGTAASNDGANLIRN